MNTNVKVNRNQKNDGMTEQKTNEDYNKQKPNPNDPNQNKEQKKWHSDTIIKKRNNS